MTSDLSQLQMTSEKVRMTLRDWTVHSAEYFYPELGSRTYRVPALYFNHQNLLRPDQAVKKRLLPPPPAPSPPPTTLSSASSSSSSASSASSSSSSSLSPPPSSSSSSSLSPSSSSSSSSSSSVSSSACPSPSPSIPVRPSEDSVTLPEDVPMESGDSVSRTLGESAQNVTKNPLGESPTSVIPDMKKSDSKQNNLALKTPHVCANEHLSVNDLRWSGEGLSQTSSSCNNTREPHLHNACTDSKDSHSVENTDCRSRSPDTNNEAEFVMIEADEQTVANGCAGSPQTNPHSSKRKGKRRRKKKAKHAKTIPEKRSEQEHKETRTNIQQPDPPVPILKEPIISESEDDEDDDEEEPNEKKERSTEPSPPSREHTQKNDSSTQASNHPVPSRKSSQKLKGRGARRPKTTTPAPVQVMFPPQESMLRRDRAMSIVLDAFQAVGGALEEAEEGGLFILHGINYDHYLCRLPARLLQGSRGGGGYLGDSPTSRGILDILILHPHAGMVLVQVKSVGGNQGDWEEREEDRVRTVKQVTDNVRARSSRLVADLTRELMGTPVDVDADAAVDDDAADDADGDEGDGGGGGGGEGGQKAASPPSVPPTDAENNVLHVLAIPFIPRAVYDQAVQTSDNSTNYSSSSSSSSSNDSRQKSSRNSRTPSSQMVVLCKEDFEDLNSPCLASRRKRGHSSLSSLGVRPCCPSVRALHPSGAGGVLRWWRRTFHPPRPRLSLDKMKAIVGRLCGPFSTLAVQPDTKCRNEARTFGHCVSETATRYSSPCLTLTQFDLLTSPDPYVALCAPPGSGKSLLLTLKAVQWLEQGAEGQDHVVVASLGHSMAAPPRDHLMQSAICDRTSEGKKSGEVLHMVLSQEEMACEEVETEIGHVVESLMNRVRAARSSGGDVDPANGAMKSSSSDKFHFVVSDVDMNEEKTLLVLYALRRHPLVHGVWWSTSEPIRSQEMTSHFRVEILSHVTRRPLHVQRVMKAVEWRERWRAMYATDSVQSALPTEGPPVIWIQHQQHRHHQFENFQRLQTPLPKNHLVIQKSCSPDPSQIQQGTTLTDDESEDLSLNVLEQTESKSVISPNHSCVQDQPSTNNARETLEEGYQRHDKNELNKIPQRCKSRVNNSGSFCQKGKTYLSDRHPSPMECQTCAEELADIISELMIDSINPDVPPFSVGSTKFLRDPSKSRFGEVIEPRDILILTDFVSQTPRMHKPGNEEESSLEDLVHPKLISRIQEVIPLRVLTEESSSRNALPGNSAVLTDIFCARGLESKVVIYIPGHSALVDGSQNVITQYSQNDFGHQRMSRLPTETCLAQNLQLQINKSKQKDERPTFATTNLSINQDDMRHHQAACRWSPTESGRPSGKDTLLSCGSSRSSSSCSVCEKAEEDAASPEQRFVRGVEDTNLNTLIVVDKQKSVPRSVLSEEIHLREDVLVRSDSPDAVCIEPHESLNGVRDAEEDGKHCTAAIHRSTDICRTSSSASKTETGFQHVSGGNEGLSNTLEDQASDVSTPHRNKQENNNDSNSTDFSDRDVPTFLASTPQEHEHYQQERIVSIPSRLQDHEHAQHQHKSEHSDPFTSTGKGQLPRWMEDKQRLISQRRGRRQVLQVIQSDIQCGDVHRASTADDPEGGGGVREGGNYPETGDGMIMEVDYLEVMNGDLPVEGGGMMDENLEEEEGGSIMEEDDPEEGRGMMEAGSCGCRDLDSLLEGLSDVTRRGVYAAAACCLAQLVVVLP